MRQSAWAQATIPSEILEPMPQFTAARAMIQFTMMMTLFGARLTPATAIITSAISARTQKLSAAPVKILSTTTTIALRLQSRAARAMILFAI